MEEAGASVTCSQPKAREEGDQEPVREGWEEGAGPEPCRGASGEPPGDTDLTCPLPLPQHTLWVPGTQWRSMNAHNGARHAVVLTALPNLASCVPRGSTVPGCFHVAARGICDSHPFARVALCSSGTDLARPSGKSLQTLHALVTGYQPRKPPHAARGGPGKTSAEWTGEQNKQRGKKEHAGFDTEQK